MDSLNSLALKLSWSMGDPFKMVTNDNLMKYTDFAASFLGSKYELIDIKHGKTPISVDENDPLGQWLKTGGTTLMYVKPSSQEEYDESVKANSIFGIPLLSYHSDITTDESGMFWKRHVYGTDTLYRDPLAPDNLMRKGQTVAILSLAGVSIYYGAKYGYKYYKNRR